MGLRLMRTVLTAAWLALCFVATAAFGQQNNVPADVNAAVPGLPARSPASQNGALFAKQAVLRGMLGDVQVQAILRSKTDMDGLEGNYFRFGESIQVLLAGELDGDAIFLEESENGVDVSGQWEGVLRDGELSGTWTSFDGSVSKPFTLAPLDSALKPSSKVRPTKTTPQSGEGRRKQ